MNIEDQLQQLTGNLPHGLTEGVALGTGLAEGYDFYESPLGQVIVTFNPEGVSSVDIADGFEDRYRERHGRVLIRSEAPTAWRRHIPEAIERGTPGNLPVDLRSVTDFQEKVLRTTATIPKGEVRPYGWVAYEVASPRAVRAVGSAVARNPIPLIIPCHRVVRSDGHIGNYSLGGPHNKIDLLEHEGAMPRLLEELAARHVRVRGNLANRIYCLPACHRIREASEVIDFRSTTAAEQAGYVGCEHCRPHG
jgi:O-6-methylguanine DNA methyltransferase